jgi:hypothetical protein
MKTNALKAGDPYCSAKCARAAHGAQLWDDDLPRTRNRDRPPIEYRNPHVNHEAPEGPKAHRGVAKGRIG